MPYPIPLRIFRAPAVGLSLLLIAAAANAKSPYDFTYQTEIEQIELPWDGPGAAIFNPARIAETRRVDLRVAFYQSRFASPPFFMQTSARAIGGLYAGIAYFSHGNAVDGSNAVYEESILTPMAAYGMKDIGGSGTDAAVGIAYSEHEFNVFNAVRSNVHAFDLGVHAAGRPLGRLGRPHVGLALRNLAAEGVRLPDDNPGLIHSKYKALRFNAEVSLFLEGILDRMDAYMEWNYHAAQDPAEGPDDDESSPLKSLGLEYRPIPLLGVKAERTWMGRWTGGLVLRASIRDILTLGAELDVSHDKFLSHRDEGEGFLWTLAFNVGL